MTKRYKIYAAPRAEDGRYRFISSQPIYIKEFSDQGEMLHFWKQVILPASSGQFGMRYELSMTEFVGAEWDFVGDPRYADRPILNGKEIGGAGPVSLGRQKHG